MEFPSAPYLSLGQHFGGLELLQILIITPDNNLLVAAHKIQSPLGHWFEKRHMLPMVCDVVLFGLRAQSRAEIDWLNDLICDLLVHNVSNCAAACIGLLMSIINISPNPLEWFRVMVGTGTTPWPLFYHMKNPDLWHLGLFPPKNPVFASPEVSLQLSI
jgi:hypothetical protein